MATISKTDLVAKLSELDPAGQVEASVERALATLGWAEREVFTGGEVVAIGTQMALDTQAELAASPEPADRARAAAVEPYMEAMRDQVLPHLDPRR